MRKLLLLRPEPGLSASSRRARALGLDVIARPLFRVEPVDWMAPDPARFDGLLLTSPNAVRHGGVGLERLKVLPVHAVGPATADAAHDAGFTVSTIGETGVADLLDGLPGTPRFLHRAGEDRRNLAQGHFVEQVIVYRSAVIDDPELPPLDGLVVAIHSPRAGARLAALAADRRHTAIAAISEAAATACGDGWEQVEAAVEPNDPSLLALAARLCHTSARK